MRHSLLQFALICRGISLAIRGLAVAVLVLCSKLSLSNPTRLLVVGSATSLPNAILRCGIRVRCDQLLYAQRQSQTFKTTALRACLWRCGQLSRCRRRLSRGVQSTSVRRARALSESVVTSGHDPGGRSCSWRGWQAAATSVPYSRRRSSRIRRTIAAWGATNSPGYFFCRTTSHHRHYGWRHCRYRRALSL